MGTQYLDRIDTQVGRKPDEQRERDTAFSIEPTKVDSVNIVYSILLYSFLFYSIPDLQLSSHRGFHPEQYLKQSQH